MSGKILAMFVPQLFHYRITLQSNKTFAAMVQKPTFLHQSLFIILFTLNQEVCCWPIERRI
ncbi:hypothetical protein, partial [Ochrobactrum sp. SFR4]|uniref:hypothetical protein n=1 Tax=Ochrobactrum sp. SFR4 TaxID=2717368 RepID=UPI001C8BB182